MFWLFCIIGALYLLYNYPSDIFFFLHSIYEYIVSVCQDDYIVYYNSKEHSYSYDKTSLKSYDYVFSFEMIDGKRYIKIMYQDKIIPNCVPLVDETPFYSFEFISEDYEESTCIDIYDSMKKFFVKGNYIDRNVLAFILLYYHSVHIQHCPEMYFHYMDENCENKKCKWEESADWKIIL